MKTNRRTFIGTLFAGLLGLVLLDAFWFEKYIIDWKQYDLSQGGTNRLKAIQISDLHLKSIESFHNYIAQRINREFPDVVFITGDSITRTNQMGLLHSFLGLMDDRILKIAILGNKEHSGRVDLDLLRKTYKNHNGLLLINESYEIWLRNRKINIIGVDDYALGAPDIVKSIGDMNKSYDAILLSHCPAFRDDLDVLLPDLNINLKLILSGHTHGGQITFFGIPIFKPHGSGRYLKGWYTNTISKMYVSKGIGTTIIPIRFGARAEATIFYI
ncbi:MAG: metallophosphoesterase [Maribacter sp.]|nr:metallophosphoesterase [Maribacter sp.]